MTFSDSNPDNVANPLRVSRSIIYVKKAPAGDYQATISATVNPQGDIKSANIALTVTQGTNYIRALQIPRTYIREKPGIGPGKEARYKQY